MSLCSEPLSRRCKVFLSAGEFQWHTFTSGRSCLMLNSSINRVRRLSLCVCVPQISCSMYLSQCCPKHQQSRGQRVSCIRALAALAQRVNESQQKQFTAQVFEQRLQRSRSYLQRETPRGCDERKHASATHTHSSKDKHMRAGKHSRNRQRCIAAENTGDVCT